MDTPLIGVNAAGVAGVATPQYFDKCFIFLPLAELLNTASRCHFYLQCADQFLEHNCWFIQGRIQGAAPIFGKVYFIFYIVYNVWKMFLKLNFDFIVAEIRAVFGSVGVYVCVSRFLSNIGGFRNRGRYCFFVLQRPNFEWYPRPFWSQKCMPDCRKSHLIFFKFSGGGPRPAAGASAFGARFGASPPIRAPSLQNSWIRPCYLLIFRNL